MNLLNFLDRLDYAMKQEGLLAAHLARDIGMTRSAMSQLLNGSSKSMRPEHLIKAARRLNVRIEWLAIGEEPMRPRKITTKQRILLDQTEYVSEESIDAVIRLLQVAGKNLPQKAA